MDNTGEQYIPGNFPKRLQDEHNSRYEFAKEYCKDKKVLDVACGTGYGSYEISKIAESVIGIDLSEEAIKYAEENYQNDNLNFTQDDCTKINFENKIFDVVVSFETIEHLGDGDRQEFYDRVSKSLKDDGVFIVSTPNKKVTSPYTNKPLNEHHVLEFTQTSFEEDIKIYFKVKKWLGQRFIFSLLLFKLIRKSIRIPEIIFKKDFKIYSQISSPEVKDWKRKYLWQPRILFAIMQKTL